MVHSATLFGVGKLSRAPGTLATLATLPLVFLLAQAGPILYMLVVVVLLPLGILAAELYEQKNGVHDHSEVVIDEVAGILITMTWLPMTWQAVVAGFLLFRLLDIWKPFPIGLLDKKIPGGVGVMADDVVAGILANLILQIIYTKTALLGVQFA